MLARGRLPYLAGASTWCFEADLVEEIARHIGYDTIPTVTGTSAPSSSHVERQVEERARDLSAGLGFHEAFGYSMVGQDEDAAWVETGTPAAMQVSNPIADWLSQMRRSILPTLRRAVELNHRRGASDIRLFEVGRVFLLGGDATAGDFPQESLRLGLAWSGAVRPRHWSHPAEAVQLHDLQGVVERLLHTLQPGRAVKPTPEGPQAYQPGRVVTWRTTDEAPLAWCGHLHPDLQDDLPGNVLFAELVLDDVTTVETVNYRKLSRFPAVHRDLAVVLPSSVTYGKLLKTLSAVSAPAAVTFSAVDHYQGPPLADNEASLTLRTTLEPEDRTLTEGEIDGYRRALIDTLARELGLQIRQG